MERNAYKSIVIGGLLLCAFLFPYFAHAFTFEPDPVSSTGASITISGMMLGFYYTIFNQNLDAYCYYYSDVGTHILVSTLETLGCGSGGAGTWAVLELFNSPAGDNYTTLKGSNRFSSEVNFVLSGETPLATTTATTSASALNFDEQLLVASIIIFFLSYTFWRSLFSPITNTIIT